MAVLLHQKPFSLVIQAMTLIQRHVFWLLKSLRFYRDIQILSLAEFTLQDVHPPPQKKIQVQPLSRMSNPLFEVRCVLVVFWGGVQIPSSEVPLHGAMDSKNGAQIDSAAGVLVIQKTCLKKYWDAFVLNNVLKNMFFSYTLQTHKFSRTQTIPKQTGWPATQWSIHRFLSENAFLQVIWLHTQTCVRMDGLTSINCSFLSSECHLFGSIRFKTIQKMQPLITSQMHLLMFLSCNIRSSLAHFAVSTCFNGDFWHKNRFRSQTWQQSQ